MPQGKPICKDVQWIIIHLSAELSSEDISMYTNISERKAKAILAHHKRTGGVDIPKCLRPSLYQKLQDEDIRVCIWLFSLPILLL